MGKTFDLRFNLLDIYCSPNDSCFSILSIEGHSKTYSLLDIWNFDGEWGLDFVSLNIFKIKRK